MSVSAMTSINTLCPGCVVSGPVSIFRSFHAEVLNTCKCLFAYTTNIKQHEHTIVNLGSEQTSRQKLHHVTIMNVRCSSFVCGVADGVKDQDSNTTGVNYDASCRKQSCKYDTQALAESPTLRQETVYAGHTPAHKKVMEINHSNKIEKCKKHELDLSAYSEGDKSKEKPRNLNETFSMDDLQNFSDDVGSNDVPLNRSPILPHPSVPALSGVNTLVSPSAALSQTNLSAEILGKFLPDANHSSVKNATARISNVSVVDSNGDKALYTSTVAGAAETKRHSSHEAADQVQEDKENQFVLGHPCSHAARAIKFDDAFASPVRGNNCGSISLSFVGADCLLILLK